MKLNKKHLVSIFFLCVTVLPAFSQERIRFRKHLYREFSFNLTDVLQHVPIIPLGDGDLHSYSILVRSRKKVRASDNRFGISGTFSPDSRSRLNSLVIRWGREWHRPLINNWTYYVGFEVLAFSNDNGNGGLALGPIAGLRYELNERLFLSTESSIFIGFGDSAFTVSARPPSALSLNIRFVTP